MSFAALVAADRPDQAALREMLDGMSHVERVHATRSLPRSLQGKLFDLLEGGDPVTVEDLMPSDLPAGSVVRHHGINSLPLFRVFQKPMYRTDDGVVGGRNVQFWAWFTGHGYFTVTPNAGGDAEGELAIDYTTLPTSKPKSWPTIRGNGRLFSRFVYYQMVDVMRRVSDHVTIGKAIRNGKAFGSYFILVREDPELALKSADPKALPPAEV